MTPLPRIVNVNDYLDYITNRIVPDFNLEIKAALEGLWSSSSVAGSPKAVQQLALSCQGCALPDSLTVRHIAKSMIMIALQDFMDPWTFNQKNLMKCCKEFLLPGGKQVPFCAYNSVGIGNRREPSSMRWSPSDAARGAKVVLTSRGRSCSTSIAGGAIDR